MGNVSAIDLVTQLRQDVRVYADSPNSGPVHLGSSQINESELRTMAMTIRGQLVELGSEASHAELCAYREGVSEIMIVNADFTPNGKKAAFFEAMGTGEAWVADKVENPGLYAAAQDLAAAVEEVNAAVRQAWQREGGYPSDRLEKVRRDQYGAYYHEPSTSASEALRQKK
ncbi:MAG: hypothetical protein A2289_23285 [Deltaproteobacteria bacterium RIFOXYA12_FULL_58_15]|nr:MAG: hypothetical protein A2289_23285 [Deltaproteobacteria bacterium RIFOXYA12_FULL_58_15]